MVKEWLGRAAAAVVQRGESPPRFVTLIPWSRWFGRSPVVADEQFQGLGEPYPRHWRRLPIAWPSHLPEGTMGRLRTALDELPPTWRQVVVGHDMSGRSEQDLSAELGLSEQQVRAILAQARAALRDDLDDWLHPGEPS